MGLIEISGQGGFTGTALGAHRGDGTLFTRPFFAEPVEQYPWLEQWRVASGTLTYGATTSAGCVAVSNTAIDGTTHTVHTSKWQRRAGANSPWTDIAGTDRTGMVCGYPPPAGESGQYRGGGRGQHRRRTGDACQQHADRDGIEGSNCQPAELRLRKCRQLDLHGGGLPSAPLALPTATGGDGTLTYSLSPSVPGLTFNASTRRLTGTPSNAGTYNMTYTVTDADGDTGALRFTLTVIATGSQVAIVSLDLHESNGRPTGITFANNLFFVVGRPGGQGLRLLRLATARALGRSGDHGGVKPEQLAAQGSAARSAQK